MRNGEDQLLKTLRLLALTSLRGLSFKESIALMADAGFAPSEMGEILNCDPKIASARLSEIRKDRANSKKR